jgi:hypothetical protein
MSTTDLLAKAQPRWIPEQNGFFASIFLVFGVDALWTSVADWSDIAIWQVNWIVCLAIGLAVRAALLSPAHRVRSADLLVGVGTTLIMLWPQADSGWLALTVLALYLLVQKRTESMLWSAAAIALAVTIPTLWARFIPVFFSGPLEMMDLRAVALLTGGASEGNRIFFQHGPGGVIVGWPCTSFANVGYSLLLWLSITRAVRPKPAGGEWRIFAGIFASIFLVNTIRLAFMEQSMSMYELVHGSVASLWVERLLIVCTLIWTAFGLRRELFR